MYPGWPLTTPDNVLALFGEPSLEPLREIVLVIGPELIVVQQRGPVSYTHLTLPTIYSV